MKTSLVAMLALLGSSGYVAYASQPSDAAIIAASAFPRGGNLLITRDVSTPSAVAPADSDAPIVPAPAPTGATDAFFISYKVGPSLAELPGAALPVENVADILSHSLGVDAPNPTFAAAQSGARVSKAALLFAVQGVGADALNMGHLPVLSTLSNSALSLAKRLSSPAYDAAASPLALLNSAIRGVSPRAHGIPACSWAASPQEGDVAPALTAATAPLVASVADRVAQGFDGKPLLIAVGGSEKLANSLGVHASLTEDFPVSQNWNAATIAVTAAAPATATTPAAPASAAWTAYSTRKFSPASNSAAADTLLGAARQAAESPVAALAGVPAAQLTPVAEGSSVVNVRFTSGESVPQIDTADPLVAALLSELATAHATVTTALTHASFDSLRSDNVPDVFSVAIGGLKAIAARDGTQSELYAVSARIVDAVFGSLRTAVATVYGENVSLNALLLGTRTAADAFTPEERAAAIAAVASALPAGSPVNTAAFPSLYAAPAALSADNACARAAAAVAAAVPGASARCVADAAAALSAVERARIDGPAATTRGLASRLQQGVEGVFVELDTSVRAAVGAPPAKATESVVQYQIVLWTSIALVFVTVGALYATATMSFKKDAQLWSGLNPAWTKTGPARR